MILKGCAVLSWRYLCPRALGWTMSHMISSMRNPGVSAMMGLNIAFRYEMLCMAKRGVNAHCMHEGAAHDCSCIPWRACTGQSSSAWQGRVSAILLLVTQRQLACNHNHLAGEWQRGISSSGRCNSQGQKRLTPGIVDSHLQVIVGTNGVQFVLGYIPEGALEVQRRPPMADQHGRGAAHAEHLPDQALKAPPAPASCSQCDSICAFLIDQESRTLRQRRHFLITCLKACMLQRRPTYGLCVSSLL